MCCDLYPFVFKITLRNLSQASQEQDSKYLVAIKLNIQLWNLSQRQNQASSLTSEWQKLFWKSVCLNFLATFRANGSTCSWYQTESELNLSQRKTDHIFKRIKTESLYPQAQLYAKLKAEQDKARILKLPAAALTHQILQVAFGYQKEQKCYPQCLIWKALCKYWRM